MGGVGGVYPIILRDDITLKYDDQGIAFSLDTMHRQQVIMQQTTGTLSPGAHPGSYNGQDAYSDLLIYDSKAGLPYKSFNHQGFCSDINRLQGSTDSFEGGVQHEYR